MILREIGPNEKELYNSFVANSPYGHVIQSWEWGEFKAGQGLQVFRFGAFDNDKLLGTAQFTLHKVPKTKYHIAYLPKGPVLGSDTKKVLPAFATSFKDLADTYQLVFVKVEPNVEYGTESWEDALNLAGFQKSPKWIFTEFNFLLDLRPSEEEILARMHEKWRYNIRLSERKGVTITEEDSTEALEEHIRLQKETAKRQKFLLHADKYYHDLWAALRPKKMIYLLTAKHEGKTLASWLVMHFGKTIYYPYGASANFGREVMPVHALAWKTIQLGKSLGCESFDMWGAADPEVGSSQDIWGSHVFKEGFGPKLVRYVGTYDLVFKSSYYRLFNLAYAPLLKVLAWLK